MKKAASTRLEYRYHAMADRVRHHGDDLAGADAWPAASATRTSMTRSHTLNTSACSRFLNNADEPDYDLPNVDARKSYQQALNRVEELIAKLPDRFAGGRPAAEQAFAKWLSEQQAAAQAWTPLKPGSMKTNLPLLTALPDHSLLTSGDSAKSDTFDLTFRLEQAGVKALRLEALPHESLPAHGPGFCYYEGPKGDFFMGEFQVQVNGRPVKVVSATESYAKNNFGKNPATAMLATDGDPQTGWSCAARYGERHEAVFVFDQPLPVGELKVTMLFGRHYACPLGRFRLSAGRDPKVTAQDWPEEVAALLALPAVAPFPSAEAAVVHAFPAANAVAEQASRAGQATAQAPAPSPRW